jgi:hypothetical protein
MTKDSSPPSGADANWTGRVLATFQRACILIGPSCTVVGVVLPETGDAPLNIVIDARRGVFDLVETGMPASRIGMALQVGVLQIALDQAAIWQPRPPWAELRAHGPTIAGRLQHLRAMALRHAPQGSLLEWSGLHPGAGKDAGFSSAAATLAKTSAEALQAGWAGDQRQLRWGAAQLAGLGMGLTPAGDDFLAGFMLSAWLAHPAPKTFCQTLLEAAAPNTTALSGAFLRVAACGECSAPWQDFLAALDCGQEDAMARAVKAVLACGHSSGADTLAGFLVMTEARASRLEW